MGFEVITQPATLPVSLEEIQAEIIGYVASDAEDDLLTARLYEATEWVQDQTARQFIQATCIQT